MATAFDEPSLNNHESNSKAVNKIFKFTWNLPFIRDEGLSPQWQTRKITITKQMQQNINPFIFSTRGILRS